jgi:hypothetical protein
LRKRSYIQPKTEISTHDVSCHFCAGSGEIDPGGGTIHDDPEPGGGEDAKMRGGYSGYGNYNRGGSEQGKNGWGSLW